MGVLPAAQVPDFGVFVDQDQFDALPSMPDAGTPLNVTADAPVRLLPLTVTVIPTPADVGVKEDTVGAETEVAVRRHAPRPCVTA